MRVKSDIIECMHLDPGYALLSVQNVVTCMELFRMMDIHHNTTLNDVQFWVFIRAFTDLSKGDADLLFHLLDVDHSGEMDFEEFYLVFCVLVASKDQYEKEFIYRHSSSIFRLIDSDASGLVSNEEFSQMGILFNFDSYSISSIFNEFDISGDQNLDFGEFRLFTMACIDEQRAVDANSKVAAYQNYHQRLLVSLQDVLKTYIRTRILPKPAVIEFLVDRVRPPFIPRSKRWKRWFDKEFFVYCIHAAYHRVQRWRVKLMLYIKFLFEAFKRLLIVWKCDVFCKKMCSCIHKRRPKKKPNPENYRYFNRRKRQLAKKRKFFRRRNRKFDLGAHEFVNYAPPDDFQDNYFGEGEGDEDFEEDEQDLESEPGIKKVTTIYSKKQQMKSGNTEDVGSSGVDKVKKKSSKIKST